METSEKPSVGYLAWVDDESPLLVMNNLHDKGFFCVLSPVDPVIEQKFKTQCAGTSDDYLIVDLGESSLDRAAFILKMTPRLKGRLIVISETPEGDSPPEGIMLSSKNKIVETVVSLHERTDGNKNTGNA